MSNPPHLPVQGEATYRGLAGGTHFYRYGESWGEGLANAYGVEEYVATVTLTADFAGNTLSGCISCQEDFTVWRSHLHRLFGGEGQRLRALPTDYELHLGAVAFNAEDETFEKPEVTVMHPGRVITESKGFWGGQFSNLPDSSGNPRLVAGFSEAEFEEADGSLGYFWGMFNGLSTTWLGGGESQGP